MGLVMVKNTKQEDNESCRFHYSICSASSVPGNKKTDGTLKNKQTVFPTDIIKLSVGHFGKRKDDYSESECVRKLNNLWMMT